MTISREIMDTNGVRTGMVRAADLTIPPGVYPDMREHGFEHDDWPELCKQIMGANILIIGTPIWLGEESSVCRVIIERLYSESGKLNEKHQSIYYGRTGGCISPGFSSVPADCPRTATTERPGRRDAASTTRTPTTARESGTG